MVDRVALGIGSALGEVGARVRTAPSPALLLNGTVIVEVASLLAFPRTTKRPVSADLSEGTVGVAPAPRATDILLAVFTSKTVSIVETNLDADFLIVSIFMS